MLKQWLVKPSVTADVMKTDDLQPLAAAACTSEAMKAS